MVIRAYDEEYVSGAQRILGDAVDFAVMSLGLDPVLFGNAFAVSESSKQFAAGNPRYVAGMNGCELARKVLTETKVSFEDTEDVTKRFIKGVYNEEKGDYEGEPDSLSFCVGFLNYMSRMDALNRETRPAMLSEHNYTLGKHRTNGGVQDFL